MMPYLRLFIVWGLLLTLTGCFTESGAPTSTTQVVAAPTNAVTAPLAVNRVIFDIDRGTKYASNSDNLFSCAKTDGDGYTWEGGREIEEEPELIGQVEDALVRAGYDVARNEAELFQTSDATSRAEFLIGALVRNINLTVCHQRHWYDGHYTGNLTATGTVQVEWQVFSVLQQKVVLTFSTTGAAGSGEEPSSDGLYVAVKRGMADAAAGITANQDFVTLLSKGSAGSSTLAASAEDRSSLALQGIKRFTGSFSSNAAKAQAATVLLQGQGHGSGFLITADGYLLTNYHVVGEAAEVRVELSDHTVLIGQVVRRDAKRDIALVKVSLERAPALPLSLDLPDVGSEIFAIGAPLDTALTGTVTKGIVSSLREADGQRYIQGDVDVQHGNSGGPLTDSSGNVIGVTAMGRVEAGNTVGINFFIPIADALAALNITVN